jgi:hypothetical protein
MSTAYDDPDEHTTIKDICLKLFNLGLWAVLLYSAYQVFTNHWQFWSAVAVWIGILIAESTVLHLTNYGLRRKNRTDKWDEIYYGNLSSYKTFNRRATFWWVLGFKDHALQYIDRADWALCDAQVMLANRDEFIKGEWDADL